MTAQEQQDEFHDIRDAVAKLCAQFPGEYWRKLDRADGVPEGVRRRADGGRLPLGADPRGIWRLRAEAVGGGRDPGRDPARRLQRRRLPRPDVHDGHRAAARQRRAEGEVPARDRQRQIAAAGVRRHRADQRHRHLLAEDGRQARRRPLRRQRPEDLDQPRRAFRPDDPAGAHHAEGAGQEAHRWPFGVHRRHARSEGQRVWRSARSAP